jgi:hypothetical protein
MCKEASVTCLICISVSFTGVSNEDTHKSEASQVAVAPHIVQILSSLNNDENSKSNTQVIHIQTSDALEGNEMEEGDEFETVILSHGDRSDFAEEQVYELVSGQNLRLCLNGEYIETEDSNTIQVLQQESLKSEDVYSADQDSEQQMIELGSTGNTEETDTVVVIINTDHSQENTTL